MPNTNVSQTPSNNYSNNHHHHHQQQQHHHHHHHHQQQPQQQQLTHQLHQNMFPRQQNSISLAEKLVEESMYTPSSAPNSPTSMNSIPAATTSMKRTGHTKRERRSPIDPDTVLNHDFIKKSKSQDISQQLQFPQQQQQQPSTINNNVIYNNNLQKCDRNSPQPQPTDFSPTATGLKSATNSKPEIPDIVNSNSESPSSNNNDDDVKMEPMELVCTTTTNNDYDTISNNNDSADEDDEDNTGNVQNSMTKMNLGAVGNPSLLVNNLDDDGKQTASSTAAYLMAAASATSSKFFQNITGSYNFSMATLAATEHSSPTNLSSMQLKSYQDTIRA